MTRRTESDAPASYSLPAHRAVHVPGPSLTATPVSSSESDMYLVPEQMARSHMQNQLAARQHEAQLWRVRRVALAARRAEAAERRARLAREAAVLAARESALALAR